MAREAIATANTLEEATEIACKELGVDAIDCVIEVLQTPKKGLFGSIKQKAKVKVTVEGEEEVKAAPAAEKKEVVKEEKKAAPVEVNGELKEKMDVAKKYLEDVFANMGIEGIGISFNVEEGRVIRINLEGEAIGTVIGKRGETLDSLQYLVCLVANRLGGDYVRFTINAGNYREKREETLKNLAERMSKRVLKTGRPAALEPMNPYERRIIHAVVTDIEGVFSKSTGEEPNRKVVIKPSGKNYRTKNDNRYNRRDNYKKEEGTSEVKKPVESVTLDDNVKLYSKIEL